MLEKTKAGMESAPPASLEFNKHLFTRHKCTHLSSASNLNAAAVNRRFNLNTGDTVFMKTSVKELIDDPALGKPYGKVHIQQEIYNQRSELCCLRAIISLVHKSP